MVDVLLIQPPIRDFYLTAKRTIPYGLACMAAVLLKNGFSVQIFDALASSKSHILDLPEEMAYLQKYYGQADRSPFTLFHHYKHFGYSFDHIAKIARESQAFLVGISSLFTPYIAEALKTAESIKSSLATCKIVFGGHHPTALPQQVMKTRAVDFVIRGEGEVSIAMLANTIKSRGTYDEIPGLVYRGSNGKLVINDPAVIRHPDTKPLPALHLINQKHYRRAQNGSAVIVASRGCPMRCTYCCVGASSYLPFRRRSVASVMQEIESAVGTNAAAFIDF